MCMYVCLGWQSYEKGLGAGERATGSVGKWRVMTCMDALPGVGTEGSESLMQVDGHGQ